MLFGNPGVGMPLRQAHPSLAIDLPLRALLWADASNRVRVSYNSPDHLGRRHGMAEPPFRAVEALFAGALRERPG